MKNRPVVKKYRSKNPAKFKVHRTVEAPTENPKDTYSHRYHFATKVKPAHVDDKPKFHYNWVIKEVKDRDSAIKEALGGELNRILGGWWAPKTRWMSGVRSNPYTGGDDTEYYVLCKEIPGFRDFVDVIIHDRDFTRRIRKGEIEGFGDAMVVALILNNIDAKLENLSPDDAEHIVPFDAGWAFAHLDPKFADKNFKITSADLDALPGLDSHYSYHWFGIIQQGNNQSNLKDDPTVSDRSPLKRYIQAMYANPRLRDEINRAIMRAIVIDSRMIDSLCEYFYQGEEKGKDRAANIKASIKELKDAALQNKSFCDYMRRDQAHQDYREFYSYLSKVYYPSSKDIIWEIDYFEAMDQSFFHLKDYFSTKVAESNAKTLAHEETVEIKLANLPGPNEVERQPTIDTKTVDEMIRLIKAYVSKRGEINNNEIKLNWLARHNRDPKKAKEKLNFCAKLLNALEGDLRISAKDFTTLINTVTLETNHKFRSLVTELVQLANGKEEINLLRSSHKN